MLLELQQAGDFLTTLRVTDSPIIYPLPINTVFDPIPLRGVR